MARPLFIWTLALLAGCDSDLYSDTSACRDLNAATPCDGEMLINASVQPADNAWGGHPVAEGASVHECEPNNEIARRIGNVMFGIDGATVSFLEPAVWRGPVETKPTLPPQDPPSISVSWKSTDGRLLKGQINWPDDAIPDPHGFGVQSGLKNQVGGWGSWRCRRVPTPANVGMRSPSLGDS